MNDFIEREARLFEAGDYTDTHGVIITEADLDIMVDNFQESPIKIEHTDTPFDGVLGDLKSLVRKGKELWGRLSFNPTAWALAEQAGAKKLSIGLKRDKSRISEVSLVRNPRVASAEVFSFSLDASEVLSREDVVSRFAALWVGKNESTSQEVIQVADETNPKDGQDSTVEFEARLKTLENENSQLKSGNASATAELATVRFQLREQSVDAKIDALKRQGRLTPALEGMAKAILMNGDSTLKFNDADTSVSGVFEQLLAAMPAVVDFSERGPSGNTKEETVEFSEDVISVTMKMRPDLTTREATIEFLKKYA